MIEYCVEGISEEEKKEVEISAKNGELSKYSAIKDEWIHFENFSVLVHMVGEIVKIKDLKAKEDTPEDILQLEINRGEIIQNNSWYRFKGQDKSYRKAELLKILGSIEPDV